MIPSPQESNGEKDETKKRQSKANLSLLIKRSIDLLIYLDLDLLLKLWFGFNVSTELESEDSNPWLSAAYCLIGMVFIIHYLSHPDYLVFLPDVVKGLQLLQTSGFRLWLIVVTNQSGIARGYFSLSVKMIKTCVHPSSCYVRGKQYKRKDNIYIYPHRPRMTAVITVK